MLKGEVLRALRTSGGFVSGQAMSRALNVTRAAVWKAVEALRAEGYVVESRPREGYRLVSLPDSIAPDEIAALLPGACALRHLICLASTTSTNDEARRLALDGAPHGTVVVAGHQSAGKGRLSRSFFSPPGAGLYLSALLRPETAPETLLPLTAFAAVAVCDAVERLTGARPTAKWPNDILFGGRKLCGILTEATFEAETGRIGHIVVGVGINLSQPEFPGELKELATSLRLEGLAVPRRAAMCAAVLEGIDTAASACFDGRLRETWLARYRADCLTIGQTVYVTRGGHIRCGLAVGVDDRAALLVRFDGGEAEAVSSGEVTLRPPEGRGGTDGR